MKNLAGEDPRIADAVCESELREADIMLTPLPEFMRKSQGEVRTIMWGTSSGWTFRRAWYYWVAEWKPPAPVSLPMNKAVELHEEYGTVVRVDGHCGCPAPDIHWGDTGTPHLYHIDTQEGLNAFVEKIKYG
jgi:hypothetical protein